MVLKRKRSDEDFAATTNISPLSSASSYTSSISRGSQSPTPAPRSLQFDNWSRPAQSLSSTLNSRTRKRYRDNRPDETSIYQNTLNRLYTAQKAHPYASPVPSTSTFTHPTPLPIPTTTAPKPQRSTLHAFWTLPQPPSHLPSTPIEVNQTASEQIRQARCEDCERPLVDEDAMEVDEAGDAGVGWACGRCGRRVCDLCAVAGERRVCLGCATAG